MRSFALLRTTGRALRYGPRRRQLRLGVQTLRSAFASPRREESHTCEFSSLEHYATSYSALANILRRSSKTPPPGELDFLHFLTTRGTHFAGAISFSDAFFLTAMTSVLAPARAVEIGTLTGFSAAIIAAAIRRQHPNGSVETIDLHPHYLLDRSKAVGFEIPHIIPDYADAVRIHTGHQADYVGELVKRDELELIFIDADHQHPRPLLDLLRVAPYVRSGGWIVLHDIQLGTWGRTRPELGGPQPAGAQWLFELWPFRKISGGNIGAVQIPPDKSRIVPPALKLMRIPFELTQSNHAPTWRALFLAIDQLAD